MSLPQDLRNLANKLRGHIVPFQPEHNDPETAAEAKDNAKKQVGAFGIATEGGDYCTAECPSNYLSLFGNYTCPVASGENVSCQTPTGDRKALAKLTYLVSQKEAVRELLRTTETNKIGLEAQLVFLWGISETDEVSADLKRYLREEGVEDIAEQSMWKSYPKMFNEYRGKAFNSFMEKDDYNATQMARALGGLEEQLKTQRAAALAQCKQNIQERKQEMRDQIEQLLEKARELVGSGFYRGKEVPNGIYKKISDFLDNLRVSVKNRVQDATKQHLKKETGNKEAIMLVTSNGLEQNVAHWDKLDKWPQTTIAQHKTNSQNPALALDALDTLGQLRETFHEIQADVGACVKEWKALLVDGEYSTCETWPKKTDSVSPEINTLVTDNALPSEMKTWGTWEWEALEESMNAFKGSKNFIDAKNAFENVVNQLRERNKKNRLSELRAHVEVEKKKLAKQAVQILQEMDRYGDFPFAEKDTVESELQYFKKENLTLPQIKKYIGDISNDKEDLRRDFFSKVMAQNRRWANLHSIQDGAYIVPGLKMTDFDWKSHLPPNRLCNETENVLCNTVANVVTLHEFKRNLDHAAREMLRHIHTARRLDRKKLQKYYDALLEINPARYEWNYKTVFLPWWEMLLEQPEQNSIIMNVVKTFEDLLSWRNHKDTSIIATLLQTTDAESWQAAYDKLLAVSEKKHTLEMEDLRKRIKTDMQNQSEDLKTFIKNRLKTFQTQLKKLELKWYDNMEVALSYSEAEFDKLVRATNPTYAFELDQKPEETRKRRASIGAVSKKTARHTLRRASIGPHSSYRSPSTEPLPEQNDTINWDNLDSHLGVNNPE